VIRTRQSAKYELVAAVVATLGAILLVFIYYPGVNPMQFRLDNHGTPASLSRYIVGTPVSILILAVAWYFNGKAQKLKLVGKGRIALSSDPGCSPAAAEYLAKQLEKLVALPLETPEQVEQWYKECETVQGGLAQQFPQFEPWHELWHYFSDADIRSRDIKYRDRQHHLISQYVDDLREKARNLKPQD